MTDVTSAIFAADIHSQAHSMRRNLQIEYVTRMLALAKSENKALDHNSKATLWAQLKTIESWCQMPAVRQEIKSHKEYLKYIIARNLYDK